MHLEASDPSFIDALITHNAGRNDRLDRIDRLIDYLSSMRLYTAIEDHMICLETDSQQYAGTAATLGKGSMLWATQK